MKIDEYSFGSMSIGGKQYSSDLIIYPDGKVNSRWWRKQGHRLSIEDLNETGSVKPEIVIIGTGAFGMMRVRSETAQYLQTISKRLIVEKTAEAVKQFNELSKNHRVAGLFHLTC